MVAAQHHTVGLEDGGPASGLEGLRRLVDKERAEVAVIHNMVGAADERATDHAGLLKEVGIDLDFQLRLPVPEAPPQVLARAPRLVAEALAQRLADVPQLVVVGMVGIAPLIAAGQHLVAHLQRIAYAQDVDAAPRQLLAYPVDSGIARSADKHLRLALQRLNHGLHQRGRLARTRRAVHHSHVHRRNHLSHSPVLDLVEPRQTDWRRLAEARLQIAHQRLAQTHNLLVVSVCHRQQSLVHNAIGSIVDSHAHAQHIAFGDGIERLQGLLAGKLYLDDPLLEAVDKAGERQLLDVLGVRKPARLEVERRRGLVEERHRLARLKVVLKLVVGLIGYRQNKLVHSIIARDADSDGILAVRLVGTTADVALAQRPVVGLHLIVVLHPEQLVQCPQAQYARIRIHNNAPLTPHRSKKYMSRHKKTPFPPRPHPISGPYQLRPLYNICTIVVQYLYNW